MCASERPSVAAPLRFVLVGGFLGAGKTTLLARAAERLTGKGLRVGIITNDQATDLVDTEVLGETGSAVQEVGPGCFCCGFDRLMTACDRLIEQFGPDILLGEPVGSYANLSTTVLHPLARYGADRFVPAPFTVLADPERVESLPAPDAAPTGGIAYILRRQLDEADRIVLNKVDLLSADRLRAVRAKLRACFPDTEVMELSALTGDGLDEWLDVVTHGRHVGRHVAEVDYDVYAEGEAGLGWLNALVRLRMSPPADWAGYGIALLERLRLACEARSAEIAHIKLHLRAIEGTLSANLTSTQGRPSVQGAVPAEAERAALIFNARVEMDPETLRTIVEEALAPDRDGMTVEITRLNSFRPAQPKPTYRLDPPRENA